MIVDVYVLRLRGPEPDVLCLRRAPGQRSQGTWETVHGHIAGDELPVDAALRELSEETGLVPERFYNASRVESFYLHRRDVVSLIPVFCAVVPGGTEPRLSAEHDAAEWLPPREASLRFAWPRERRALTDVLALFGGGDAGLAEDVLRIR